MVVLDFGQGIAGHSAPIVPLSNLLANHLLVEVDGRLQLVVWVQVGQQSPALRWWTQVGRLRSAGQLEFLLEFPFPR